jgi:hypothetical protein
LRKERKGKERKGKEGGSQKASGRLCEGLRLTRTTMGFSLAADYGVDASLAAADAMAGDLVGLNPKAQGRVRASAFFYPSSLLS